MKRIFSILLALALSLGLVMVAQTPIPVLAANMYESYNVSPTNCSGVYGSYWYTQTFTPSAAHTITSVKLRLSRFGSPGTITVGIRTTFGGQPTGGDLCSGTINGNTLTTSSPGAWYEITLGGGYGLSAGTQYAIVVRALGGDANNYVDWWATCPGGYSGGATYGSDNSGSSWSPFDCDFLFEEWGDPLGTAVGWETYPTNKVRVLLPWIALAAAVVAGATLFVLKRRRTQS